MVVGVTAGIAATLTSGPLGRAGEPQVAVATPDPVAARGTLAPVGAAVSVPSVGPVSRATPRPTPIEVVDGFPVIERVYSDDPTGLSVGLANITAAVPDIEANKEKILRAARIFKRRRVNIAAFP